MKTTLVLLFLLSFSSQAQTVSAVSCTAHCLGIDWSGHTLHSLGVIEGLARDQRNAFKRLSGVCSRRLAKQGYRGKVYLAVGDFSAFHQSHTTRNGWSSSSATAIATWRFAYARATSSTSWHIETTENLDVNMTLASPEKACEPVQVDETELVPYYEGDQVIFG